jgi:hypothetical protein
VGAQVVAVQTGAVAMLQCERRHVLQQSDGLNVSGEWENVEQWTLFIVRRFIVCASDLTLLDGQIKHYWMSDQTLLDGQIRHYWMSDQTLLDDQIKHYWMFRSNITG